MKDDCTQNMVIDTDFAQMIAEELPAYVEMVVNHVERDHHGRPIQTADEVWNKAFADCAGLFDDTSPDLRYLDEDFDSYSPDE